jgi:hypothetical protein
VIPEPNADGTARPVNQDDAQAARLAGNAAALSAPAKAAGTSQKSSLVLSFKKELLSSKRFFFTKKKQKTFIT